jgi:hypothetical protein
LVSKPIQRAFVALAAAAVLALTGCQTATVQEPLTQTLAGNDMDARMEFWHTLNTRPVVSNDEAFHGLLLYFLGQDDAKSYEQRVEVLKVRGLLDLRFDRPANEAVTRGTLAVALVRGLKIEGGVVMRVFGATPRYSVRELRYVGLYLASSPRQTFTGAEFVGLIGRVEDYERSKQ